jgi:hypothetical protein
MSKMVSHDIWVLKTQVMAKRRVGSQFDNLTPDPEKLGIALIYLCIGGLPHIVGKLSTWATIVL